jgi:hypothetical protein
MSGAAVIADSHLVGMITVDPARYQDRLVAVPTGRLLADSGFRVQLVGHGVRVEAAPVGSGWYLQLSGEQTVSLAPAYQPVSRRFRPPPSMLLRPEHGLVPFMGRQPMLRQITAWCQGPPGSPLLLLSGGGGSGKTRLGQEACVQMLVAGWDAGLADDKHRDGAATTRLARPTLLVVDDADLRTGLISGLVEYLRWDDAGPEVRLLLLTRAMGAWWDRLVRQQGLDENYTVLDLDRHPVPPADRPQHFRCASTAFAAYGGSGGHPADPPAELADPAYAEPLLIHIAALLATVDTSATPAPPGPGQDRVSGNDISAGPLGPSARQRLLRALCERERTRWHDLGAGSHLAFNPDLPLADQVVALATLTAAADQACATTLLAALSNQAEVTRIGAEALAAWAHRLYAGPGYWNPLRPDLLAEQHRQPGGRRRLPGAGRGPPGCVPARPGQLADQPGGQPGRPGAAGGGAGRQPGGRRRLPGAGRGPPGRVPARPGRGAAQPGGHAGRPGAAGGGAGRQPGGRHHPPGAGRQMA